MKSEIFSPQVQWPKIQRTFSDLRPGQKDDISPSELESAEKQTTNARFQRIFIIPRPTQVLVGLFICKSAQLFPS